MNPYGPGKVTQGPNMNTQYTQKGTILTEIGFWIHNQISGNTSLPVQSARVLRDDLLTAAENVVISAKNSVDSLISKINPAPTTGFYLFGRRIL